MNAEQTKLVLRLYADRSLTVREITKQTGIGTNKLAEILKEAKVPRRDESGLRQKAAEMRRDKNAKPSRIVDVDEAQTSHSPGYLQARELLISLFESVKDWQTFKDLKEVVKDRYLWDLTRDLESDGIIEVDRSKVRITRFRLKQPDEPQQTRTKPKQNDFMFPAKVNKSKFVYNGIEIPQR